MKHRANIDQMDRTARMFRRMHRVDAWHKQDHRCIWCLCPMVRSEVTAEHVRPRSEGGTDRDNIAAAHADCNSARRSTPRADFIAILEGRAPAPTWKIYLMGMNRRINLRILLACQRIRQTGRRL